jgi:transcriptional regulator with GAF, ATPase, and Fis domain
MQKVYDLINKFSGRRREPDVLITGETGTGKEMFASAIHFNSSRKDKPMVKVSIPDLNPNLIESELFGHVKGAFTDAKQDKVGYFEKADGSTLFIDEISEIPKEIQTKLLRAIQEKEIQRVGSTKPISIDVRVIAATNKDLEKAVKDGSFREDLYYRLNVIPIHIPPLRERLEDVSDLARHFIHKFGVEEKEELSIEKQAIEYLKNFNYPGNVRQLENVLRRAVYLRTDNKITLNEIKTSISYEKPPLSPINKSNFYEVILPPNSKPHAPCSKFIKTFIEEKGILDKVAQKLGISHATVYKQFEQEKENIFISLCNAHGNIESLAEHWDVSAPNLQQALAKKNRILQFIIDELKKNGNNQEKLSKRLDVSIEDFKKALNRLHEIKG